MPGDLIGPFAGNGGAGGQVTSGGGIMYPQPGTPAWKKLEALKKQAGTQTAEAAMAAQGKVWVPNRGWVTTGTFGKQGLPGGYGGGYGSPDFFDPVVGGGGSPFPPGGGGPGGVDCSSLPWWAQLACNTLAAPGCNRIQELLGLCDGGGTQADPVNPGSGGGIPAGGCGPGRIRVGDKCVAPGDMFPGGDPFVTGAGGVPTAGAFGLPAMTPAVETRPRRTCPTGMVLGRDNLCYPKQILTRRSKFRKWRPSPRPAVSAADMKAIRKASRLRDKIKGIAKDAGLKATKR